jgi:hypothetical protein
LFRSFVVESFPGSSIELLDGYVKLLLGNMSEAHFLREVKSQQAVSILVGTSFPGVVGLGKIDLELVLALNLFVITHLATVVERQGSAVPRWYVAKAAFCCSCESLSRAAFELYSFEVATLAFDKGGNTARVTLTDYRITLPVTVGLASENVDWPAVNPPGLLELVAKGFSETSLPGSSVFTLATMEMT